MPTVKNKQIGFLVNETSSSQMSFFLIKNINEYLDDTNDDFVLFFENSAASVLNPNFATMSFNEIWSFDGVIISTSISTTLSLIKSFSPVKKFFYVWDLEWMRRDHKDFEQSVQAFINPSVELIARSEEHAKAIENYCNRKVKHIVNDFNIENIVRITNE